MLKLLEGVHRTPASSTKTKRNTSPKGKNAKKSVKRKITKAQSKRQHRRLGHASNKRIRETAASKGVTGLEWYGPHDKIPCDPCMRMNKNKASFKLAATTRSEIPGQRMHSDVKTVDVRSKGGAKYAVCFIDDCTREGKSYPMARKSEVLDKWRQFLEEEVMSKGYKCQYLRSDNGGEYISHELIAFNNCRGITAEYSSPHCQSGNGVAEVYWRETFKMVRAILWDQQREKSWWASALSFADYIRNRLTATALEEGQIPEAAWTQAPVDMEHLRVPLSTCWSFVEKTNRDGTLDAQTMKGVFIGYAPRSRSYIVYDIDNGGVYHRRHKDVNFDERMKAPQDDQPHETAADKLLVDLEEEVQSEGVKSQGPERDKVQQAGFIRLRKAMKVKEVAKLLNTEPEEYLKKCKSWGTWYKDFRNTETSVAAGSDMPLHTASTTSPKEKKKTEKKKPDAQTPKVQIELSQGVRRSLRNQDASKANRGKARVARALAAIERETESELDIAAEFAGLAREAPKHYNAAHKNNDETWTPSEDKEWGGLWDMGAFQDEPMEPGRKLHHLIWTYKVKSDGTMKARLCLDGRRQDPSTYGDVRSPTMRLTSLRIMLAMSAQKGWNVLADDATQAFLNAERPEDKPLWASYPQGRSNPGRCVLLRKMLYGLHDAPKGWYDTVTKHLVEDQGLQQSQTDECLFTSKSGDLFVIVHVDDFLSTGTDEAIKNYREQLHARFKMTGGPVKEYYGLEVTTKPEEGFASLGCRKYMERTILKLGISPKEWGMPMNPELELERLEGECDDKELQRHYRQLVGSAMHPAVTLRPDCAGAVRMLSSHLQNPGRQHLAAAKRVIQYLHHTRDWCLEFHRHGTIATPMLSSFYGTCDASHNCTHDSKGITGWAYQLCHGAIAWKCRAQNIVTLSSTEAELVAIDEAVRELRYLHKLLKDFGQQVDTPTLIGQDNMSTLALCKSSSFNARTKHVALRYHHAGEQQALGAVRLEYLSTGEMTADILTKPLAEPGHTKHAAVLLGRKQLLWQALEKLKEAKGTSPSPP